MKSIRLHSSAVLAASLLMASVAYAHEHLYCSNQDYVAVQMDPYLLESSGSYKMSFQITRFGGQEVHHQEPVEVEFVSDLRYEELEGIRCLPQSVELYTPRQVYQIDLSGDSPKFGGRRPSPDGVPSEGYVENGYDCGSYAVPSIELLPSSDKQHAYSMEVHKLGHHVLSELVVHDSATHRISKTKLFEFVEIQCHTGAGKN